MLNFFSCGASTRFRIMASPLRGFAITPYSVGLLCTSDETVLVTSTWLHTTLRRHAIHAAAGIRTRNPRKRAAAVLRLRPRGHRDRLLNIDVHYHHKHQGLDPLIRSISRVTAARANASSVFKLFSFSLVCSGMISKVFSVVAFFASVKASSVCIHLSCLVCL